MGPMEWVMQKWVDVTIGALLAAMLGGYRWAWMRLKELMRDQAAAKSGTKALLQDRIVQAYCHFDVLGYCPIHNRENIEALHKEYKTLGGNGTVSGLVDRIMALPTSPPETDG